MASSAEIVTFLDHLLEPERFRDVALNGLQVPGADRVERVATGVSATRELLERAVAADAQLVLVHHGLFWTFDEPGLTPITRERLRVLLAGDVGLLAHHLPLDAHPEHGNNALLADALGATRHEPYALADGTPVGRVAHWEGGIGLDALVARVAQACGRGPLVLGGGPDVVNRAAIVSGAAADEAARAAALGLDLLLTGEPRERTQAEAREAGITVLAAGHHDTETRGVRRLGDLLADRFGLEHVWIDVPNPV